MANSQFSQLFTILHIQFTTRVTIGALSKAIRPNRHSLQCMQISQIQHILIVEAGITNRHILQVDILAQINSIIQIIAFVIINGDHVRTQRNTRTPTLCYSTQTSKENIELTNVA